MIITNYVFLFLANVSKLFGRGITYRKKLFDTTRLLESNYPLGSPFSLVQVGANDGKSFDSLYSFVVDRDASGVLIEPIKDYYNDLCENYINHSRLLKVNKAVHKTEQFVTIYKIDDTKVNLYPKWVRGMASFDKTKLVSLDFMKFNHVLEEKVPSQPLMDIIDAAGIDYFDYFQVDTEGYDYEVIDMFNFERYQPKLIKAEFVNLNKKEQSLMIEKLKSNGYYIVYDGLDIIGINLREIKL